MSTITANQIKSIIGAVRDVDSLQDLSQVTALADSKVSTLSGQLAAPAGASMVGFVPTGSIASTTVQTAIAEVSADLTASIETSLTSIQAGTVFLLTSVAGTNTITGNLTPAIASYVTGQTFRFVAAGANTGAVTININGLGAKAVTKSGATALASGDIPAGAAVQVFYDGIQFQLTIVSAAASGANSDITSLSVITSVNGGQIAGFRNRIINGNFGINQRVYVSGATVGVGLYGHDRWKMAASGDTYAFSTTANVTTVTIPAGKVLQQVIEGLNLETGTYTLSWTGTAQGKIGAGSYGTSGITGSITGGTNTTIEFGPGTVSKVQLEFGSTASVFEQRPYGIELALCQRYCEFQTDIKTLGFPCPSTGGYAMRFLLPFHVTKRVSPTFYWTIGSLNNVASYSTQSVSVDSADIQVLGSINGNTTFTVSGIQAIAEL